MRRILFAILAGFLLSAQASLPGTPPGLFISRGSIDQAPTATPVALDVAGTATQYNATLTPTYTGITVGSGTHRALVCAIGTDLSAGLDPVTAIWDVAGANQTMTNFAELGNGGSSIKIVLFGLVAPAAGNKTLTITFNSLASGYVSCIAFTNVLQTGSTATFAGALTTDSAGVSPVALTTSGIAAVDGSVAALMCASGVHRTATSQTSWYGNSSGPGGNSYGDYALTVGAISDTIDGGKECVMAAMTLVAG